MKQLRSLALVAITLMFVGCDSDSDGADQTTEVDASMDDDVGEADDDGEPPDDEADDDALPVDDDTDDDVAPPADDDTDDDVEPADDDLGPADDDMPDSGLPDAGDDEPAIDDDGGADDDVAAVVEAGVAPRVTYYQDALPIFETRCLGCHQEGGIAPFRLDDYETAAQFADLAKQYVAARIMPPFLLTHGEGCGDFRDARWMTEEEIATIGAWADGGAVEGEPRDVVVPPLPMLEATEEVTTPVFTPEPTGSEIAEFDEYRCFLLDRRSAVDYEFLTGYQVNPGNARLVHHVTVSLVGEGQESEVANPETGMPYTNGELMALLDAESPDRDGWPCYSGAGDGVSVNQLPIVWAPGQGAVNFPNESGTYITPEDRMVVQVHYNLHDESLIGQPDQTTIRLQMASIVTNVAFFVPVDPLLDSLEGEQVTLAPGEENVEVSWSMPIGDTAVGGFEGLELWGVFPHMHELGQDYSLSGTIGGTNSCLADMTFWDFDWQLAYFYEEGIPVTPTDTLSATCHYDTSERMTPVLPGWGTQNEMCFTGLLFTVPVLSLLSALGL
jgi:hypothetical protein